MNPIVFALDVSTKNEAKYFVNLLKDYVGCFKIGLELFISAGPSFVKDLSKEVPIFLDLKLHDIPETVRDATRAATSLGASFLTVHIDDGCKSLRAATEAASGTKCGIIGITVLTSISNNDLVNSYNSYRDIGEGVIRSLVYHRASQASQYDIAGVICSEREAGGVHKAVRNKLVIIPIDNSDQINTLKYIGNTDMIIIGKKVINAADPVIKIKEILNNIKY